MTAAGAPTDQAIPTALWTGNAMLLWGVGGATSTPRPGALYDPAADAWRPTTTAGAPRSRMRYTAVWAGTKMIIWGGRDSFYDWDNYRDGGAYDPATDSWSPISTSGAPDGVAGATSVWTGSRVIVWGGLIDSHDDIPTNTGAMYDPVRDSWTPISTAGAPSARWEHRAVWTGTRMIVWGGKRGNTDAGIYDPGTDSWTTTNAFAELASRTGYSALWTGTRLTIWGGWTPSALNTGQAYDPTADRWSTLSTIGAPTPRGDHSAIWTGSRMVVWGGSTAPGWGVLNSGGVYDLEADSWLPTRIGNAPAARAKPKAVWTGSSMVVWGGSGLQSSVPGGVYDPAGVPALRQLRMDVLGGGRVVDSGGTTALDCNSAAGTSRHCETTAPDGDPVILTATASAGYRFTGWGGDCSGGFTDTPFTVWMMRDMSCTATFTRYHHLEVQILGNRLVGGGNYTGRVSVWVGGSFWQTCFLPGCSTDLPASTPVVLTASPDPGNEFAGWSGACVGSQSQAALTMDSDKSCAASFGTVVISTRSMSVDRAPHLNGDKVHYTITLANSGSSAQQDNPGAELETVLPGELEQVSATSSGGTVALSGGTLAWNGAIVGGGSVTIDVDATVKPRSAAPIGTPVVHQGTIHYDVDADGVNESTALTDDPAGAGSADPTTFVVSPQMRLYTLQPCRVLDTRDAIGPRGGPALQAGTDRSFPAAGVCGIPPTAVAVAANLTVTRPTAWGHVRMHPAGTPLPPTSAINYFAGQTRANNAVLTLGDLGQVAAYCGQESGSVDFVVDVTGYYE